MKPTRIYFSALLITLVLGAVSPAQSPNKPDATNPIHSLSWLVGGVWTADATRLGPGMQRIETRYQWSENNAYLRFTTHFVSDKGAAHTYDGNLFWDPTNKTLAIWYMDTRNTVTQGPMQVDGDTWRMTFRGEDFEGKMADLRVDVVRKTNDRYRWTLQEKQGEQWKELAGLDYLRMPGI